MRGQRVTDEKLEVARQQFLSGSTLREISVKTKISMGVLGKRSTREGWSAQRKKQDEIVDIPAVVRTVAAAADKRVEVVAKAIAGDWQSRLGGVVDGVTITLAKVQERLQVADLDQADWRDLATLLKILTDSLEKLSRLLPSGGRSVETLSLAEAARQNIEKQLGITIELEVGQ